MSRVMWISFAAVVVLTGCTKSAKDADAAPSRFDVVPDAPQADVTTQDLRQRTDGTATDSALPDNDSSPKPDYQATPPDPICKWAGQGSEALQPQEFKQGLAAVQSAAGTLTKEDLVDLFPVTGEPLTEFDYVPSQAGYMDLILDQLELTDGELQKLDANGFMVTRSRQYDNPTSAYLDIYYMDLPVIVTSDSILHAWHKSYDEMLMEMEEEFLISWLGEILDTTLTELDKAQTGSPVPESVIQDLDVFLTVGKCLLTGPQTPSVTGAVDSKVEDLLGKIEAAQGLSSLSLFGAVVDYDFSQFKVRGHYTESEELGRYFKSMMWLGRTNFLLADPEVDAPHGFELNGQAFSAMCLLHQLVTSGEIMTLWTRFSRVIDLMVGETDSMDLADTTKLFEKLGGTSCQEVTDDQAADELVEALLAGGFGLQQINSGWLAADPYSDEPAKLSLAFNFFGQRFVVDSYVFSNVVYDRIPVKRMLPAPADALFVLGNNAALWLLGEELGWYDYQGQLNILRFLVEAYPAQFWRSNLYNLWLELIRSLTSNEYDSKLPQAMQTSAWKLKTMQAQLASWAQLRHDTILYVKQSYTSGTPCAYPEGYVEPVPALYETLQGLASCSNEILVELELPDEMHLKVQTYFQGVAKIAGTLQQMAEKELAGEPFSKDENDFIESIVYAFGGGSDGPLSYEGWYADLHYGQTENMIGNDATIADVHTDANDPDSGTPSSPQILHVGTGYANLMVFTTQTCEGPKAYVGPAFSYYEYSVPNSMERLNDDDWKKLLKSDSPPKTPAWTEEFTGTQ